MRARWLALLLLAAPAAGQDAWPSLRGSGLLTFVNPLLASNMYLDAANASMRGAFASGVRQVDLEAGQLVLFPSSVLHDVKPYEGDVERITVAFNCWFQLPDA